MSTTNTHNESTMDKIKDTLHIGGKKTTHEAPEGTHGPHGTRTANAADPRIDSDRDHRANPTTGGLAGTGTTHTTGTHNPTGTHTGAGYDQGVTGTHHTGTTTGTTGTHHTGTTTGNHGLTGNTGTQHTGGLSNSTNAGPHDSNLANKADPRVDSDLDSTGNRHGANTGGILGTSGSHATRGSGTAQNTDGPHNSDLANKLDPRVDSDRDASKTIGGNKTNA